MARTTKGRGRLPKQRPSSVKEAADWLRRYAIDLYPPEQGKEADWPVIAQAVFATAFGLLDEAPAGDARAYTVLRRVEEGLYKRFARDPAGDLPPALAMGDAAAPARPRSERLPEPRHHP